MTHSTKDQDPLALARAKWITHGWADAEPGMAAVTSIIRAANSLRARVEDALEPFALNFARYEVLTLLMFSRARTLPMTKIASRLQIQPASLSYTTKRLEEDGYIARYPNPDDKRGALIGITDQGIALVNVATKSLNQVFRELGVSGDEVDGLIALLHRIS